MVCGVFFISTYNSFCRAGPCIICFLPYYKMVMPTKNTRKIDVEGAFYHIYNRGVEKRVIFKDDQDYAVFLSFLKRYLDTYPHKDNSGREYTWLAPKVELLAFCLMPNHFHLLALQKKVGGLRAFMQSLLTSYSMYFNWKYKRVGPLFQHRYAASMIDSDSYLLHISRYIHLNPEDWQAWQWSSLPYYLSVKKAGWVHPELVLGLHDDDSTKYQEFLSEYVSRRAILKDIKHQLANY